MELGDVDYIQGLVSKHFSLGDVACFDFAITTIAIAAVGWCFSSDITNTVEGSMADMVEVVFISDHEGDYFRRN